MIQQGLSQGCKNFSIYANQSIWYTILTNWKIKSHMIISEDAEKAFDKIQYLSMIKTSQKIGIKGTYLNITKAIYNKPTARIILNGWKLKAFPLRSVTRQGCQLKALLFNIVSEVLATAIREKEKEFRLENKVVKQFPEYILYILIENPKNASKKLLELIKKFCKTVGYKINTQKSFSFSYTNMEKPDKF